MGDTALKAPPFAYWRARSQDGLFALLTEFGGDARILAGGQSLVEDCGTVLNPMADGMPDVEVAHVATRTGTSTLGARVTQQPFTPERVLRSLGRAP